MRDLVLLNGTTATDSRTMSPTWTAGSQPACKYFLRLILNSNRSSHSVDMAATWASLIPTLIHASSIAIVISPQSAREVQVQGHRSQWKNSYQTQSIPQLLWNTTAITIDRGSITTKRVTTSYLMLDLGSDIQDNAELIRGEVGSYRDREFHMTLEHVPFDPNLTCPYCQKVFRKGEIQKFKRHVQLASCKVSADDGTVV